MKKTKAISLLTAMICSCTICAPSVYADEFANMIDKGVRETYLQYLLENETVKKYYDIITADMSWLKTNTVSFTVLDVTGDDIPELIVSDSVSSKAKNGARYDRIQRKFYSLKTDKAEYMYAASFSRDYLTPYYEGKTLKWLYSDHVQAGTEDDFLMTREYGFLTFGEEKVRKEVKFKAYECADKETDTFAYRYESVDKVYTNETVSDYSKDKEDTDSDALSAYEQWYRAAGLWESDEFDDDVIYKLEPISDHYIISSDNTVSNIAAKQIQRYQQEGDKTAKKTKSMFRLNIAEILDCYVNYENSGLLTGTHRYRYSSSDIAAAKPVIYLYPEKTEDITVTMDLNGSFGCTYPEYQNGWSVTADPDGTLYANGKEYSYLYWDAELNGSWDMSKGFVIKGSDTAEFLREKLSFMGLTPKEYNEFIVYWLPRMEKNPYNLITFQTKAYENAAKLSISPEPDSILRIFMVYVPLDKYTDIPEQELESFKRTGFTVVEWGGAEAEEY